MPIIELKNVEIFAGDNLVFSDMTLSIEKGEFVYLMGKVGSGKTSIIRALIGEIPISKGEAKIGKFDLTNLPKKQIPYLRRSIGVVFQDFQLLMDRSVYDNLSFVLKSTGWKEKKVINDKITSALDSVGMLLKAHKMPHQLSGGEQQRVAIARALLNDPEIIIADEPTGNLDHDTACEVMDVLLSIHKERNPAILMVTHNQGIFKKYPARTVICENLICREYISDIDNEIDFSNLL